MNNAFQTIICRLLLWNCTRVFRWILYHLYLFQVSKSWWLLHWRSYISLFYSLISSLSCLLDDLGCEEANGSNVPGTKRHRREWSMSSLIVSFSLLHSVLHLLVHILIVVQHWFIIEVYWPLPGGMETVSRRSHHWRNARFHSTSFAVQTSRSSNRIIKSSEFGMQYHTKLSHRFHFGLCFHSQIKSNNAYGLLHSRKSRHA